MNNVNVITPIASSHSTYSVVSVVCIGIVVCILLTIVVALVLGERSDGRPFVAMRPGLIALGVATVTMIVGAGASGEARRAEDRHEASLHPSVSSIAERSGLHEVAPGSGVYRDGHGTTYAGCSVTSVKADAAHVASTLYCATVSRVGQH